MGMQPQQGSAKGGQGPTWGQGFNQSFPYVQPQYGMGYGGGNGFMAGGGGQMPQGQPMGVKGGGQAAQPLPQGVQAKGQQMSQPFQNMASHGQNYQGLQGGGSMATPGTRMDGSLPQVVQALQAGNPGAQGMLRKVVGLAG